MSAIFLSESSQLYLSLWMCGWCMLQWADVMMMMMMMMLLSTVLYLGCSQSFVWWYSLLVCRKFHVGCCCCCRKSNTNQHQHQHNHVVVGRLLSSSPSPSLPGTVQVHLSFPIYYLHQVGIWVLHLTTYNCTGTWYRYHVMTCVLFYVLFL